MGLRVRVLKKRVVEYGGTEAFNYGFYKLMDVLGELGVESRILDDEVGSDAIAEVSAKDLKKAVTDLKKCRDGEDFVNEEVDYECVKETIFKELGCTLDKFVDTMEKYMKEGDCHNGYYYFTIL